MMIGSFFRDPRQSGGRIGTRKWWLFTAGLLLAVGLLYWLRIQVGRSAFRWPVLLATVAGLQWGWLVAASALSFATFYGRALRWKVLLEPLRPDARLWSLFTATVIGFTAITLLGRPGEFVRPYLIALRHRVPFSSQIAAWVLERIYDMLIALLIFGFGLTKVELSAADVGPAMAWVLTLGGWVVGIICGICLLLLLAIRHYADRMRKRLMDALGFLSEHHLSRAERLLQALMQGVESTQSDRAIALLLGYTLLEWLLIGACYYSIAKAFGDALRFSFVDVVIFTGFTTFGSVIQIPGIGGGVQVAAVLVLTELFGLPIETATTMALLIWLITFVVTVPAGLGLSLYEGVSWRKIKQLDMETTP